MATFTKKKTAYRCERCSHEWEPRGPRKENRPKGLAAGATVKPKQCPHCKSAYWETKKPGGK